MRTAVAWVLGAVTLDALRWGNLPGGLGFDCKAAWTGHVGSTYPAVWAQFPFPFVFQVFKCFSKVLTSHFQNTNLLMSKHTET
jgi:hypothetical protein